ncbi:MAG: ASKHA domain-containing protein [Candidatus Omnitrophica bacterium]|nr:ASKHA domain-containing protein [Candidatus Omnitrophota bacterium]
MAEYEIVFLPDGKKIKVPSGTDVLSAALKAGVFLVSSCGGKGICGRCKVKIISGDFISEPTGKISSDEKKSNIYLACQTFVKGNMKAEILPQSRLPESSSVVLFEKSEELKHFEIPVPEGFDFSPLTEKIFLDLPHPSLQDNISDLGRILRALQDKEIRNTEIDLSLIRKIPQVLRESNWQITATFVRINKKEKITGIEPGNTSHRNFGIAIDIGTTTIVVSLIDLKNGKTIGTEISLNRQATHGDDIISRIVYAEDKEGLEQMHHLVVETINETIQTLATKYKVHHDEITAGVCSGNMTMIHLLLKIDPSFLRREPYIPAANYFPAVNAIEVGIRINPAGVLYIVGGVSSYVGGDITSGVLISGIFQHKELQMLIDIGTNGEIVLGNKDWLICCSASAGPAFEGSGVKDGMRAITGAVRSFRIVKPDQVKYSVVGNVAPIGICGSGYVEILAELFSSGIIDRSGNLVEKGERVRYGSDGMEFVIAYKNETGHGKDIVITQIDIENLLRAKAAIFAGIRSLVARMDIKLSEIERFCIGGGFGNYLNIDKSITIGLLPDLPVEKFIFMGNTSLAGARVLLISATARSMAEEITRKMTYLELSMENSYMEEYLSALFVPHTSEELFPTVFKGR